MNDSVLKFEVDMLQGNINRLCFSNDLEELMQMLLFAKKRLDIIYTNRVSDILLCGVHKEG